MPLQNGTLPSSPTIRRRCRSRFREKCTPKPTSIPLPRPGEADELPTGGGHELISLMEEEFKRDIVVVYSTLYPKVDYVKYHSIMHAKRSSGGMKFIQRKSEAEELAEEKARQQRLKKQDITRKALKGMKKIGKKTIRATKKTIAGKKGDSPGASAELSGSRGLKGIFGRSRKSGRQSVNSTGGGRRRRVWRGEKARRAGRGLRGGRAGGRR